MVSHVQLMLTPSMWGAACALVIALPTYWGDVAYKKHIGKIDAGEFLAALPVELVMLHRRSYIASEMR